MTWKHSGIKLPLAALFVMIVLAIPLVAAAASSPFQTTNYCTPSYPAR